MPTRSFLHHPLRVALTLMSAVAVLIVGLVPLTAAPAWADVVPTAPTLTSIEQIDNGVWVIFTPGTDSGSAVTGWTATCSSSDGGAPSSATNNNQPPGYVQVRPLTLAAHYTCSLHATNAAGDSAESAVSDSVQIARVPDVAAHLTATSGNHQVSFSFDTPFDGGDPITSYRLTCSVYGAFGPTYFYGASSPIVATNLPNGHPMGCRIETYNLLGGSVSGYVSGYPDTLPSTPAVDAVTNNNGHLSVAFTPDYFNTDNVVTITATCSSSDGGVPDSATAPSAPMAPIDVPYLTMGKSYTCTVHGTNQLGDSPESAASAAAIPNVVPDPPLIDHVTPGTGQLTTTFFAGPDDGTAVTSFTATCTSSNGGVAGSVSGASSPLTVTALTNGKSYTCTVHATNADGDSAESAASSPAAIGAPPANIIPPTITGSSIAERTLSAHEGTWSGTPTPTLHPQWQRCKSNGANCTNIAGATATTYVLTNNDVDHAIRLAVTATNTFGSLTMTATGSLVVSVPPRRADRTSTSTARCTPRARALSRSPPMRTRCGPRPRTATSSARTSVRAMAPSSASI